MAALFGTASEFIHKCPCQAKDRVRLLADKIMLFIQKLEERLCARPGALIFKVQNLVRCRRVGRAKCGGGPALRAGSHAYAKATAGGDIYSYPHPCTLPFVNLIHTFMRACPSVWLLIFWLFLYEDKNL